MHKLKIDNKIKSQKELFQYFSKSLKWPDDFGHNLDAFFDMLLDQETPLEIHVDHADELSKNLGEDFTTELLELLQEASEDNDNIHVMIMY